MILGSAALMAAGCRQSSEPVAESPKPVSKVPLRVAWSGSQAEAEEVQRVWSSVSPQPVNLTVFGDRSSLDSTDSEADASSELMRVAGRHDVVVYPIGDAIGLVTEKKIRSLSKATLDEIEQSNGRLYPGLSAATRWTPSTYAVPIGCKTPAMLFGGDRVEFKSWADYDAWVKRNDGRASEALQPGWAGMSFLWRAARSVESQWLFDRETFEPLIDRGPFVAALDQMVQTASRYQGEKRTPDEVWNAIADGDLVGGIGMPANASDSNSLVQADSLPNETNISRLLLAPDTPAASITTACRQSTAAASFVGWITGGEGSQALRGQIQSLSQCRTPPEAAVTTGAPPTSYERQQVVASSTPAVLPTLAFEGYRDFYHDLDAAVTSSIDGKESPKDALSKVAKSWARRNEGDQGRRRHKAWLKMLVS